MIEMLLCVVLCVSGVGAITGLGKGGVCVCVGELEQRVPGSNSRDKGSGPWLEKSPEIRLLFCIGVLVAQFSQSQRRSAALHGGAGP